MTPHHIDALANALYEAITDLVDERHPGAVDAAFYAQLARTLLPVLEDRSDYDSDTGPNLEMRHHEHIRQALESYERIEREEAMSYEV